MVNTIFCFGLKVKHKIEQNHGGEIALLSRGRVVVCSVFDLEKGVNRLRRNYKK